MKLILENGDVFKGASFGCDEPSEPVVGEVVFNTGMTGYQEVFSDPSYCDQIIVMTYPLIGNYGVSNDDYESLSPTCKGVVAREFCERPSHWKGQKSIKDFVKGHQIPALHGIDTRKLVKVLRSNGAMKGALAADGADNKEILELLKKDLPKDQISRVSAKTVSHFPNHGGPRVVMLDFGYKKNILSSLLARGFDVVVVPWNTSLEQIESYSPQGIMLSNGPGDPKDAEEILPVVKALQEKLPLFAICMGHQVFALANGADTEKLKFGHRGSNHPVKDLEKDKVYITSQNHGYTVKTQSVEGTELKVFQTSLNDQTVEGLRHKGLPAFSVQYHPEANPGPNDTNSLFDEFYSMVMVGFKGGK